MAKLSDLKATSWCPVGGRLEGWPYEVNRNGEIRSTHARSPSRMKKLAHANGYDYITLTLEDAKKTITVHTVVLETFNKPRPSKKHEVNHKNNVRHDNRLSNLEWMTHQENIAYRDATGGTVRGVKHPKNKLSEIQVLQIKRSLHKGEASHTQLARKHNVSESTIRDIKNRRSWKWLKLPESDSVAA